GKQAAKASKAKSLSALSEKAMTEAQQLKLITKRSRQQTRISQASGSGVDEGTGSIPGVPNVPTDESEEDLSWNSTNDEGDDDKGKDRDGDEEDDNDDGDDDDQEVVRDDDKDDEKDDEEEGGDDKQEYDEESRDKESFDPISKTPENSDDEGNGEEDLGLNVGREEGHDEEKEEDELYRDININQGRGIQATLEVEDLHVTLTPVNPDGMESIFETTSQMDAQTLTSVTPLPMTSPTMTPSIIATITTTIQAPIPPTIVSSTIIQDLPNFCSLFSFDNRLRTLEWMNEAVQVAIQLQSDKLREEAQKENDEFLKTIDENMQKIIKEQVKKQVKTSYAIAVDISEMELKKILIKKMEGNKSIQRSNEQRNLYKALVEAYEFDKIILDNYGDTGSKRSREGKEPESASAPTKTATKNAGRSTQGSQSRQAGKANCDWNKTVSATHGSIQPLISKPAKQTDSQSSFNKLVDTPLDFSNFLINQLKVDTLTPKLLVGPTYELIKGSCKRLVELEYHLEEVFKAITDQLDWVNPEGQQYPHNLVKSVPLIPNNQGCRVIAFEHFINNDLKYLHGGASSRKYTTSITKTKATDYGHIKWIEDLVPKTIWIEEQLGYDKHALWGVSHWGPKRQQFYNFAVNQESARDVYSKRRIIAVTDLKIRMNETVQVAVQLQFDKLHKEAQKENDEFLKTIDENMQNIIKEKVKTSYAVDADLSEMELKKILIEKMEGNKSIQHSDEQRNLYKDLVDAYESDKIILDTYGETVTLKRRHDDDADKDEEPSDRGSKRRREGKEPESASALTKTTTRSAGRSTQGSKSRQASASESSFVEEPMQTTFQMEEPSHPEFKTCAEDQPNVQSSQHPEWFSQQQKPPSPDRDWNKTLKVDTLTSELLAGPTYELMNGSYKSLVELEYHLEEVYKATTDQLDWVNPEGVSIGRKHQQFYGFAVNWESARDVYPKRRIIVVTELKIVKWHSYKHLDWITNKDKKNKLMRIDKLHKFNDGTLTDVRTALDDRLKGIQMQYLPQSIWRKVIKIEQRP
nr:hypothetical protein [Tanacetum cinerariifolium]